MLVVIWGGRCRRRLRSERDLCEGDCEEDGRCRLRGDGGGKMSCG
jgi:hypothetical protein